MKELAKKLQPFINGSPVIKIVEDEYTNEIVDANSGEVYGYVHFHNGSFSGYDKMDPEEDKVQQVRLDTPPNVNKILQSAKLFVDSFIERDVQFSMLNEWSENNYMVTYEESDPKLGLPLPHTGCTLSFSREGILASANIGQKDFELEYPGIEITSEEAKHKLRESGYVQLALHIPISDEEDTDPVAELVYCSNKDVMGVGVDGKIETLTGFIGEEETSAEKIPLVTPTGRVENMLGVTENLVKKAGEGGPVIWEDPADREEEEAEPLISISSTESEYFSFSNVPYKYDEEALPFKMEELKQKALEFLEITEGNIHDKYVIFEPVIAIDNEQFFGEGQGKKEFEEESDEEMLFLDTEPMQMFAFSREYKGFRIDSRNALVHVGLFTGIIRECLITPLTAAQTAELEKLSTAPVIPLKEAEARFFNEIELKLARSIKYFDNPKIYTLSYIVDFPKTGGHIEKINAHTGEVSYVETGIIKERINGNVGVKGICGSHQQIGPID
ncbi:hypothetical protein [Evansella clarkii]|uniref:hypothetical protein n=1 Tax=Evansella clarkii TaxID=79879 RepID=UPI000B43792D|nr:hypothetical protein [Evansella clarkii]